MNGVIGMVEVLDQSTLTTSQIDLVRTIRDSATNLLGLIDDILDFSKAEAGRLEMEQVPVALVELIEDLCQSLGPMVVDKGTRFDLFIAPDVPELVIGDALRLRQVFYNLLGNAIKFSDTTQTKRPGWISLRVEVAQVRPLQLLFRISDNGIGMTPETVAQLFTPFSQGEMSTTRRFGGTGLGLTICHRLVAIMGGNITVESRLDKGTTFAVTLPLTAPKEQPLRSWPDLTGIDCLLADSPNLDNTGLSVYLESAGARVVTTTSVSAESTLVGILDGSDETNSKEKLLAPFASLPNMRAIVLLLSRGRRRRARQEVNGIITLDGVAMRRQSFVNAVALAAGRDIPEPLPQEQAQKITLGQGATLPDIAEARAQGRLILVAEDDYINQKVILQQLALLGQRAEVAGNGAEALAMWRGGDYCLLLTDLHMPEMDGYTLAETIRREESDGRRIPILALTANASHSEIHRALATGMDEYLTKPILLQTLQTALSKWLPPTHKPPTMAAVLTNPSRNEKTGTVVDITVLQGLVGDDQDTVQEFLADYLVAAQRLGTELGAAVAAGNTEQVQAIAHKLKSSSRTVGAEHLADVCVSLEKAGQAKDRDGIQQGMAGFEAALETVMIECRAWLTKHDKEEHL
jgi:CheY-like chemotaxis protein/HPt (histidine-containing phosphotransfer) domain-containing protein/two-component sensor histidine kinase